MQETVAGLKDRRPCDDQSIEVASMTMHTPLPTADHAAPPRLLIVEDEADLSSLLQLHLSELPATVSVAADGERGLALALTQPWDLVVLDLRLPRIGGFDVCRALRARGVDVPILMLTARVTELDRVRGLELGADDYLAKPFSMLELQARIKALLRRARLVEMAARLASSPDASQRLEIGALRIDRQRRRATLADKEVVLTPREWDLLWFFAEHPGQTFSRSDLLDQVWGHGHDGYDHTVNSHINRLRAKLDGDASGSRFIHTVWGTGYRFELSA